MWGDGVGGKPDSKFGVTKPVRKPKTITLDNSKITIHFSPISPSQPWSNSTHGLIAKTLSASTKTVDLALFVFSDQKLANILEERHNQKVQIRALIEPQFAYHSYSEVLDMMGFAVIDNQTVITGSHNWSEAANNSNDETLIVIENPAIAAHYQREFNRLYGKIKPGLPANIKSKIDAEIQKCPQIKQPSSLVNPIINKINLNTATQAELETLPGVGEKLAQKIIIAREQQKFTSLQDVDKVPGISAKMLAEWETMISLISD
jgi:competence ComEA-like helix-hairpin-helix protein